MSETHINAYFADVDEKLQVVLTAQGEYEAAKDRLEVKKKAIGWVDPEESQLEESEHQEQKTVPDTQEETNAKKPGFGKKNR